MCLPAEKQYGAVQRGSVSRASSVSVALKNLSHALCVDLQVGFTSECLVRYLPAKRGVRSRRVQLQIVAAAPCCFCFYRCRRRRYHSNTTTTATATAYPVATAINSEVACFPVLAPCRTTLASTEWSLGIILQVGVVRFGDVAVDLTASQCSITLDLRLQLDVLHDKETQANNLAAPGAAERSSRAELAASTPRRLSPHACEAVLRSFRSAQERAKLGADVCEARAELSFLKLGSGSRILIRGSFLEIVTCAREQSASNPRSRSDNLSTHPMK